MTDTTQTKPEETTPADEFAAVFSGLDQLGDKPVPADLSKLGEALADDKAAAQPAAAAAETPAAEGAAEGNGEEQPKPAADAAASEAAPSGEQPAAAEKPAEKPAAEEKPDPVERLADLLTERTKQAPQAEQPQQRQAELPPHFTEEEQTFLAQYEQDFPDVARAEQLRRRADMRDLAQYIFTQFFAHITPMRDVLEELTTTQHLGELHQVAPDYDDVREKVIDWVKTQPTILRNAYEQVIKEGSVEDIKFLIGEYKKASGTQQQANTPAAKPEPKETELPAATKQAVASLAPVSSKRSAISAGGVSSDDFEGAFAAWADKV